MPQRKCTTTKAKIASPTKRRVTATVRFPPFSPNFYTLRT